MRKVKNVIYYVILVVLFILLIISSKNIITWFIDNNNTKKVTEKIRDNTKIKKIKVNDDNKQDMLIDVDLTKLKGINSDTIGYIKVIGTNIDYPVVQTDNNDFYLSHSFDKSYNAAGWVFLDYRNNIVSFDDNTIFYAHGRLDNTMFGSLRNVIKQSWYNNKNNRYLQYSNEYYSSKWEVFSTYKIKETSDYLKINLSDEESKKEFFNKIKNRSVYNYDVELSRDDKIITLSSCYDDYYRVVLHAKLVEFVKKK